MTKKLNVMLINPPQKYYNKSLGFNVYFPLALLSIGAMIKDMCKIKVYDCLIEDFEIQTYSDWIVYGTSDNKLKKAVKEFNPDIIGITIPFSSQSNQAKNVSRICKEVNSSIVTVMGGPHATVRYKQLLEEQSCDFVVVGEGEMTFSEFVRSFAENKNLHVIKGVASKVGHEIHFDAREMLYDLDRLPIPSYDLINHNDYLNSPYLYKSRSSIGPKSISMITSRGCPYKCTFCSIHLHMGRRYRYHSPDYVMKHLRYCVNNLGINRFHFEDDNISLMKDRFETILDDIIDSEIEIKWDTPNGIRADTLDYNILKKIKLSGNTSLQFAIESGNQRVLDNIIKKGSSLEEILKITDYCKELDISLRAFYVIGFPGETLYDIQDTINLALQLFKEKSVFPILLFATPLYGTELYDECVAKGLIEETISDKEIAQAIQFFGNPLITTEEFSSGDLKKIGKKFEEEIDKHIGGRSYRQILIDKNSLFAK